MPEPTVTTPAPVTAPPPPPAAVTPPAPPAAIAAPETPPAVDPKATTAPATTPAPAKEPLLGAAPPPAPKELELKLPDGMTPEAAAPFLAVAKANSLSQAQAQALVDFDASRQKAFSDSLQATHDKWRAEALADKEVGGDGRPETLKANLEKARRAIEKFGGPELMKELAETGLGNHPVWVRAFVRIGAAMADDSIAGSSGGAAAKDDEAAFLKFMYPTMSKKES